MNAFRRCNLLGRDALRILAIGAENRYVHSGEALFSAGETADGAYVVQEGSFSLSTNPTYGEEARVGPFTLLGELAMITETKRPMTATALEPSSVLRIPRSLFLKMLESFPESARRLRDILTKRTRAVGRRDVHGAHHSGRPGHPGQRDGLVVGLSFSAGT